MKTLYAAILFIFAGQASANSNISANDLLGLKTVNDRAFATLDLNQSVALRAPPRGLCAKADYYCSRGYENWCEVWIINRCDEL